LEQTRDDDILKIPLDDRWSGRAGVIRAFGLIGAGRAAVSGGSAGRTTARFAAGP